MNKRQTKAIAPRKKEIALTMSRPTLKVSCEPSEARASSRKAPLAGSSIKRSLPATNATNLARN